jgi:phosphotransferase system enzyme I (PtsI)
LRQANALVEECKSQLRAEGLAYDPDFEIGVMIEIPSAVISAGAFAGHCRFFSIGTNDLIQYSLAVDRLNDKIAHLYQPTHPAIVRLIKMTVESARPRNVWVSVCGEMAGDPVLAPLLLGLGVDELSAAPAILPQIKFIIRRLKMSEAAELAGFALTCESGPEILERAQALAQRIAPSLFEK